MIRRIGERATGLCAVEFRSENFVRVVNSLAMPGALIKTEG